MDTTKVTIFHNQRPHIAMDDGWRERDPLLPVFTFILPTVARDGDLLDQVYREFNIGKGGPLAEAYRKRRLRSLSKGDVVAITREPGVTNYYHCASVGWEYIAGAKKLYVPITTIG